MLAEGILRGKFTAFAVFPQMLYGALFPYVQRDFLGR